MEFKLPTETIELPSKGLIYSSDNPLSSGTVEIKYMTAKEEDILTNQNYISNGTVLDKLLKSLIVSEINYNDLLIGDKNGLMVAARILGYGKDYKFKYQGTDYTVDLSLLDDAVNGLIAKMLHTFPNCLHKTFTEVRKKKLEHWDKNKESSREWLALNMMTEAKFFDHTA